MSSSFEEIVKSAGLEPPMCEVPEGHKTFARAVVLIVAKCCDHSRFMCATHTMELRVEVEAMKDHPNAWWVCPACEAVVVHPTWKGIASVRSLL